MQNVLNHVSDGLSHRTGKRSKTIQRSIRGALSYNVIHDVFVLFRVEVIWFDTLVGNLLLPNFQVHRPIKVIYVGTSVHARRPAPFHTRHTNRLNPENNRGIGNVPHPCPRCMPGGVKCTCHSDQKMKQNTGR